MLQLIFWREVIVLFGALYSSYTDIKTGMIRDSVTYPMIFLGLFLLAAELYAGNFHYLFLLVPIVVFAAGYILYFLGKIGGGDVKMFTAIALLLPVYEGEIFLLNVLFVAAISSIVFLSVFYFSKYCRKGIRFRENSKDMAKALLLGAFVTIYFSIMVYMELISHIAFYFLLWPVLLGLLFLAFQTGIKRNFFLKRVPLSKLEEDEIVARDFLSKKALSALGSSFKGVLSKKEILRLKKAGISEVPVYRGLPPFAPFLLLGVAFSLLFPHFFSEVFFL